MAAWWTCPMFGCGDRMATSPDPRTVERDRDAHLARCHAGASIEPRLLRVSWWSMSEDPKLVQV